MAQIIQTIFSNHNICSNAVARREVRLSTLRNAVKSEGHSFEVFQAIVRMRG